MNNVIKSSVKAELDSAQFYLNQTLDLIKNNADYTLVILNSRMAQKALENANQILLFGHLDYCMSDKLKNILGKNGARGIIHIIKNSND